MLGRDRGRFKDARSRLNESPPGPQRLLVSFQPTDAMTANALGFDRPAANAMDAVSDRDFALEFWLPQQVCSVHLTRFAEVVIWSSDQFGFIVLSDAFTTGSSIMPQKRNPDAAELVRASPAGLLVHERFINCSQRLTTGLL